MKRTVFICILALSFCLSSLAVPADAYERGRPWLSDQPWEKLSVTFGYFLTSFRSDVSLGPFSLNLEDVLGLDATTSQYRVGAHYRAWRRHHFHFSYYDLSRDATKTLEVSLPEEGIEAGALLESTLDITIYQVGYSFSFWNDDRVDLGVGLGFHIMELGAGVNVLVNAQGETVNAQQVGEAATLPLPVFGLRGNIAITKRVFFKQSIEAFYISLSGFEGLLVDANLAVEGHICRFFGLGMAYNFMRVEIEGNGDGSFLGGSWNGKVDYSYSGVSIYAKFFF